MTSLSHDAKRAPTTAAVTRVHTTVRLSAELHERVKLHVVRQHTSLQEWIEAKIVEALDREAAR